MFGYAHNDTSAGERESRTAQLNSLRVSERVHALRKKAFEREIPVACDETLNFLNAFALAKGAKNILEVGSAEGITALSLLEICKGAHITTIEREERFYNAAKENLSEFSDRATLYLGDAAEVLDKLCGQFDLIFLDCAKVQYIKLLPRLKQLLCRGGALVADDVLLYGYVNGEKPVPKKRKMLVEHVREYLDAVRNDDELLTSVLDVGDGLALSVKF